MIFLGNGEHSVAQKQLLHQQLDHALMLLCGSQQNGGMGSYFDQEVEEESQQEIHNVVADLVMALTGRDFLAPVVLDCRPQYLPEAE